MWVEQISFSYARMYLGEVLCFLIDTLGEEKILYQDADGVDYGALHVFNMNAEGCVSSYLRMFPKVGGRGVAQIGSVWTRVHGAGEGVDTPCANETSTGI